MVKSVSYASCQWLDYSGKGANVEVMKGEDRQTPPFIYRRMATLTPRTIKVRWDVPAITS